MQARRVAGHGEKSRRISTKRILRRFASASARSTEPSGKEVSSFAIRAASWQSSLRVRRISSVIVSTRMVSSIVPAAPIAAFWEAPAPEGGGRTSGRNAEEERASTCVHRAEERCFLAGRRTRLVRTAAEEKRVRAVAGLMSRAGEPLRRAAPRRK